MSLFRRDPAPTPQTNTVVSEPATVEAAKADYEGGTRATQPHPSSLAAAPHTLGRKK